MSDTATHQTMLFQRLRLNLLRNSWNAMLAQSTVRPITILVCSIVVWAFVFAISYLGFRFLVEGFKIPPDEQIISILLGLLFFSLGVLLVFSSGVILYASLFTAAETNFLLSKPVRADQVFAYKFQGAIGFSSWGFLLLGGPILIAYGLVCNATWFFYLMLPLFFVGFILLPGALGGILCLLIVNYLPRRRKELFTVLILVILAGVGLWIYQAVQDSRSAAKVGDLGTETANKLLTRISFARSPLLPSSWVARGLVAAGRGDFAEAGYQLALVWSNGLFIYLVSCLIANRLYRRGFNRLATGGDLRRKHGGAWMDRLLSACLPFAHPSTRLLIVKDFRTFRRDPAQYGQVLLFVGLLVLYFTNVRRLYVFDIGWAYQNGNSFLNLSIVALLLCTYTGRFIYPLLSMEGRKFWILGLLPLQREQLLWGKFAFSLTGGLILAETLMILSDLMLEMPWDAIILHAVTVAVLAAGLSGLSVGLGACMPNFRESDPSKIVAGFGGTLNLVAGLLFLVLTVALMAGPWHLFMTQGGPGQTPSGLMWPVVIVAGLVGVGVGLCGVIIPLRAGIAALRRMEF